MKNPFDELAKTLAIAKGMPRRDALRLIGGGLAGGVLAAFGVGKALGQGNSPCAHFCVATFPPGPDRGQCVSDAAHHTGICFECGPAAPEGHPPLCGQVCCAAGQVCQDGTCITPNVCTTGFTCGSTTVCGSNESFSCFCFETTEGVGPCSSDFFCAGATACTTSGDCPTGEVCTTNTCCGVNLCAPACNVTGNRTAVALRIGGGPTASGAIH
jgi:hypothetical protein